MPEEHVTDIERDLALLLDIEPSPEFAPRLRERVADTPASRPWLGWALAAASIVLVAVGWLTMRAPVTTTVQQPASGNAPGPALVHPADVPVSPAPSTPVQRQPKAFGEARGARRADAAEVIVDPAFGLAVQRLMRDPWHARTDIATLVTVPADGPPVDLAVAPMAVGELAVPEIAVGNPQFGAPR